MLDTISFIQEIDKIYLVEKNKHIEDKYKKLVELEESEMELLEKLEIVREKKRLNEIEATRNYVINQFIRNSNNYFNNIEAKNLMFYLTEKEYHPIVTYLTLNDKNLLVSLQLINRFTIEKNIRYEDALEVIRDYLFSINI
jgi:hypothetical protein